MFTELPSISVMYTTIRWEQRSCQIRHGKMKQNRAGADPLFAVASSLIQHTQWWRRRELEAIRSKWPPARLGVQRSHERAQGSRIDVLTKAEEEQKENQGHRWWGAGGAAPRTLMCDCCHVSHLRRATTMGAVNVLG